MEVCGLSKWDYYQNLPFGASGDHGSNICIERLAPERIADVQRAVCTSGEQPSPCRERSARLGVKATPCREPSARLLVKGPWPQYSYRGRKFKKWPQYSYRGRKMLKGSKVSQIEPKSIGALAWQDFSFFGPFWPNVQTCPCTFCKKCLLGGEGPRRRGVGGR